MIAILGADEIALDVGSALTKEELVLTNVADDAMLVDTLLVDTLLEDALLKDALDCADATGANTPPTLLEIAIAVVEEVTAHSGSDARPVE